MSALSSRQKDACAGDRWRSRRLAMQGPRRSEPSKSVAFLGTRASGSHRRASSTKAVPFRRVGSIERRLDAIAPASGPFPEEPVTVKLLPRPNALSTRIEPPCRAHEFMHQREADPVPS